MKKFECLAIAVVAAVVMGVSISSAQTALPNPSLGGTTPWWMLVCPGGIVTAAVVKNAGRNKELTTQEAWTCGFLYWWNEGTGQYGPPVQDLNSVIAGSRIKF